MVSRLIVSYRGDAYVGWQRQPNGVGVQQVIEDALGELAGEPVAVVGAGRTDAGVHARRQVAHLRTSEPVALRALVHAVNHRLPEDVRVVGADRMPPGFHARKTALGKEYLYRLFRGRVVPAPEAPFTVSAPRMLAVEAVQEALSMLPGRPDWSAFAVAGGAHRQPYRRLFAARLEVQGRTLLLRFWGEGFLRGMVRGLVGTLLEVGGGRRSPASLRELLAGAPRAAAGPTAPARGLCLERVFYPGKWSPLESYRP